MSTSFVVRLHKALADFNLQEAITLSDALHEAEANGVEHSRVVEDLWMQLTIMIEGANS